MKNQPCLKALALAALLLPVCQLAVGEERTLIHAGKVIDGVSETVAGKQTITVAGERIVEIADSAR